MQDEIDNFCRTASIPELERRLRSEELLVSVGAEVARMWVAGLSSELAALRELEHLRAMRTKTDAPALGSAY